MRNSSLVLSHITMSSNALAQLAGRRNHMTHPELAKRTSTCARIGHAFESHVERQPVSCVALLAYLPSPAPVTPGWLVSRSAWHLAGTNRVGRTNFLPLPGTRGRAAAPPAAASAHHIRAAWMPTTRAPVKSQTNVGSAVRRRGDCARPIRAEHESRLGSHTGAGLQPRPIREPRF